VLTREHGTMCLHREKRTQMWTTEIEYQSAERKAKTGYVILTFNGKYVGKVVAEYAETIVARMNAQ
jgi:hypothetical protein